MSKKKVQIPALTTWSKAHLKVLKPTITNRILRETALLPFLLYTTTISSTSPSFTSGFASTRPHSPQPCPGSPQKQTSLQPSSFSWSCYQQAVLPGWALVLCGLLEVCSPLYKLSSVLTLWSFAFSSSPFTSLYLRLELGEQGVEWVG